MKLHPNIAINENGLLFNPSTGESFTSNPLGAEIINMLKEGKPLQDITSALHEKYDVDEYTVEKDLIDFLQVLKKHTIIHDDE